MRVFFTFVYYGVFVYVVSILFLWVRMKPDFTSLSGSERGGLLFVAGILLGAYTFISESHISRDGQGYRADFLDNVLGKGEA